MTEHLDKKEFEEWRKRVEQNIRLMAAVERRMEKKLDELIGKFELFKQSIRDQLAAAKTDIQENKVKIEGIDVNLKGSEKDNVKGLNSRVSLLEDLATKTVQIRTSIFVGVIMLFLNLIVQGAIYLAGK